MFLLVFLLIAGIAFLFKKRKRNN
ncbi:LPXTG cell wall anchor domain-containing protein [Listeria floridensis]